MCAPSSGCAPKISSSSIASSRFRTSSTSGRQLDSCFPDADICDPASTAAALPRSALLTDCAARSSALRSGTPVVCASHAAFQSPFRSSALFSAFRPFASKSRSMRRRRSPACFPAACTRRISAAKSVKQASSRYTSATASCFSTSASCASVSTVTATGSAQSRAATPDAVNAIGVCSV